MVRAKFRCNSLEGNQVTFTTVYEPDAAKDSENARFTKATPWGEIKMAIDNPAALDQFAVGQELYVDFSPVAAADNQEAESGAQPQGDGDPAPVSEEKPE